VKNKQERSLLWCVRFAQVNKNDKTDVQGWPRSVMFVFGDLVGHHYPKSQQSTKEKQDGASIRNFNSLLAE
jgi:hypothetical protein